LTTHEELLDSGYSASAPGVASFRGLVFLWSLDFGAWCFTS
jgi:hypothetical protein